MAMSGSITEMSLVDLIQLACMERYTARLTVVKGNESARTFFANGEIVHAEVGGKTGSEALYEIVSWTKGDFSLDRGIETEHRTIKGTWTAHLLEALVRIDHSMKDSLENPDSQATPPAASPATPRAGGSPSLSPGGALKMHAPPSSPPAGSSVPSWLQSLKALKGVKDLVLVRSDGMPHELAPGDQSEEASALTAFLGNAAKGIGETLNLGTLQRAEVQIGGLPRVVVSCGDCYAGIEISKELNSHHVALEAQKILNARDES